MAMHLSTSIQSYSPEQQSVVRTAQPQLQTVLHVPCALIVSVDMLPTAVRLRTIGKAKVVTDAAGEGTVRASAETLDVPVTSALMVSRVAAVLSASLASKSVWSTVSSRVQLVVSVGHIVVATAQLFSGPVMVMPRRRTLPLLVTVTGQRTFPAADAQQAVQIDSDRAGQIAVEQHTAQTVGT
jgi:hypothetical protein